MRSVMFLRLSVVAIVLAAPLFMFADDNFCADCAEAYIQRNGEYYVDAQCCMAVDDEFCYPNYFVMDVNVGHGCLVSPPDEFGNESCVSNGNDFGCGGGGQKDDPPGMPGSPSCKYDMYGYCDVSCSSCTF